MKIRFALILSLFLFAACQKENEQPDLDGRYIGTFYAYTNGKKSEQKFEVSLENRRFVTHQGGAGLGPFEIGSGQTIKFVDELYYTANFDWNTILTGEYSYQLFGDSLILNKIIALPTQGVVNASYQYRLKKMN